MIESCFLHAVASCAALLAVACASTPGTSVAPTELQATGSLRNMHLRWTGDAGSAGADGYDGYDVYRSDGAAFVRINQRPVRATSYDDPIDSPAGDGIWYRYQVAATGGPASEASNIAGGMHGTRLAASYPEGFGTRPEASPYVIEHGTTAVDGDLWVSPDTRLYVLDAATIDFRGDGHSLLVDGTLRAEASAAAPAAFTAHRRDGGYLADGEGFRLVFAGPPYSPGDPSGSLLDHVRITNLAPASRPDLRGPLNVIGTGVALQHVKLTVNTGGEARDIDDALVLDRGGWIILRNSVLDGLLLRITTDLRDTPFEVTHDVFRGGTYSIMFQDVASPAVRPGQIDSNDLDASRSAYLLGVTGTAGISVGHNYWAGGTSTPPLPFVFASNSTAALDFGDPGPPLAAAPAGAGPDW